MGITSLRQYHEAPVAAEVSSEAPVAGEAPAEGATEATATEATAAPADATAATDEPGDLPDPFEPEAAPDLDGLNRGSSRAAWAAHGEAEVGTVAGWTDSLTRDQLAVHYLGAKAE